MGDPERPSDRPIGDVAKDVVAGDAATTTGDRPGKVTGVAVGGRTISTVGAIGAVAVVGVLLLGAAVLHLGPFAPVNPAPSAAAATTQPSPPPAASTPPPPAATTPPASATTPPPAAPTTVTVTGSYAHTNPGVSSTACATTQTSPALAGAPVTTRIATSNGAVSGPSSVSGTTAANGSTKANFTITQFGTYTFTVVVTLPDGTTKTVMQTLNVTSAPGGGC